MKFSDINVLGLLMCRSYKLEFWISNFTKSFFKFFNVYFLLTKLIIGQTRKLWPIKLSFSQFWTGFEVLRKKKMTNIWHISKSMHVLTRTQIKTYYCHATTTRDGIVWNKYLKVTFHLNLTESRSRQTRIPLDLANFKYRISLNNVPFWIMSPLE